MSRPILRIVSLPLILCLLTDAGMTVTVAPTCQAQWITVGGPITVRFETQALADQSLSTLQTVLEPAPKIKLDQALSRGRSFPKTIIGLVRKVFRLQPRPDLPAPERREFFGEVRNTAIHAALTDGPSVQNTVPALPALSLAQMRLIGSASDAMEDLIKILPRLFRLERAVYLQLDQLAAYRLKILKSGLQIAGAVKDHENLAKTYLKTVADLRDPAAVRRSNPRMSDNEFDLLPKAIESPREYIASRVIERMEGRYAYEYAFDRELLKAAGIEKKDDFFVHLRERLVHALDSMPTDLEPWSVVGNVLEETVLDLIVRIARRTQEEIRHTGASLANPADQLLVALKAPASRQQIHDLKEFYQQTYPTRTFERFWEKHGTRLENLGYSLIRFGVEVLIDPESDSGVLRSFADAIEKDAERGLLKIWRITRNREFAGLRAEYGVMSRMEDPSANKEMRAKALGWIGNPRSYLEEAHALYIQANRNWGSRTSPAEDVGSMLAARFSSVFNYPAQACERSIIDAYGIYLKKLPQQLLVDTSPAHLFEAFSMEYNSPKKLERYIKQSS